MKRKVTEAIIPADELDKIANTLGEHTKNLKEEAGEKWEVFTKKTGVAQTSVSDWINKKSLPKMSNIVAIAYHYDVSIDWLLGLNTEKKSTPTFLTYKEWIDFIENTLDSNIAEELYYPSLDNNSESAIEKEQKRLTLEFLDKIMPNKISVPQDIGEYRDSSEESTQGVIHKYEQHDIYKVSEEMNGRFPDVLQFKDTFLRCLLACLSYNFNHNRNYYPLFREEIMKKFGNKIIINFDVYEFSTVDYQKYENKIRDGVYICDYIFGKYNGIADIAGNIDKLTKIWEQLNFWNREYRAGNIKTKAELKTEFWKQ